MRSADHSSRSCRRRRREHINDRGELHFGQGSVEAVEACGIDAEEDGSLDLSGAKLCSGAREIGPAREAAVVDHVLDALTVRVVLHEVGLVDALLLVVGARVVLRLGVEVVDALPDELAPRLADTYLALKAAGRL